MAIFNPQIPDTQDPNWLNLSKPISQPSGDTSTGVALSSTADVLGDALKFGEKATKSVVEDEIWQAAKAEQADYQATLLQAKNAVQTAQLRDQGATPGAQPVNILSANTSSAPGIPKALQNLTYSIDGLGNARANGKLSETDYDMRLDAMAKDFRARYPGMVEFIDKTFEKATGRDSANKLIQGALGDINSYLSGSNAEKKSVMSFLMRSEVAEADPRVGMAAVRLQRGEISNEEAMAVGYRALAIVGKSKDLKRQVDDSENDTKLRGMNADLWADNKFFNTGSTRFQALMIDSQGGPMEFRKFMEQYRPGSNNMLGGDQWKNVSNVITANKNVAYNEMWAEANKPQFQGPGGTTVSYVQLRGEAEARRRINANLEWWNQAEAAITAKDTGRMYDVAMGNKSVMENATAGIYKEIPAAGIIAAAHNLGGPNLAADVDRQLGHPLLKGWQNEQKLKAILNMSMVQPRVRGLDSNLLYNNTPVGGEPYTLLQGLKDLKYNPGVQGSTPTPDAANGAVANIPKLIASKNLSDEGKVGLIISSFSKQNQGFIGAINPDGTTRDGKPIRGKVSVFTDMLSPDNIAEVKRLDATSPGLGLWNMTKSWAGTEFAHYIYKREITNINDLLSNPKLDISWDTDNQQLRVVPTGKPLFPDSKSTFYDYGTPEIKKRADALVFRLNEGLRSMANIYKADNVDPNVGLRNMMIGLGVKLDSSGAGKILNAITIGGKGESQPPAQKGEDGKFPAVQPLNYNIEDAPSSGNIGPFARGGSQASFLAPPATRVPGMIQNSPAALRTRSRGIPSRNLSDQNVIGIGEPESVPEGMSPAEYIRQTR